MTCTTTAQLCESHSTITAQLCESHSTITAQLCESYSTITAQVCESHSTITAQVCESYSTTTAQLYGILLYLTVNILHANVILVSHYLGMQRIIHCALLRCIEV